ncbi:MAG: hypothetical protein NT092_10735 [Bacteroidia bacterium]|nr:hypothetical protein [Bacteroidia bacterium]
MKKSVFLSLIIALIIGSCSQEKNSPIEGAWKLISGNYTTPDTVENYPLSSNNMKIIDKKYFSTIWQDTTMDKSNWWSSGFNGGTYTIENGVYTEYLLYFSLPSNIGNKAAFKAEIKNDTLILTYIFKKAGYSNVEKWKRLE